jgi:hypothetical protein
VPALPKKSRQWVRRELRPMRADRGDPVDTNDQRRTLRHRSTPVRRAQRVDGLASITPITPLFDLPRALTPLARTGTMGFAQKICGHAIRHSRAPSDLAASLTSTEKVTLFRSLFRGRDDVYPKLWENSRAGKKGYAPACANEWVRGVCEKPRVKCGEYPNQAFLSERCQEARPQDKLCKALRCTKHARRARSSR